MSKDSKKAAKITACFSALAVVALCCAVGAGARGLYAYVGEGAATPTPAALEVAASGACSADAAGGTTAATAADADSAADATAAFATTSNQPSTARQTCGASAAFDNSNTAILTGTDEQISQMTSIDSYEVLGTFDGATIVQATISAGQSAATVQLEAAGLGVSAEPEATFFTQVSKTDDMYSYNANGYTKGGSHNQYYEVSEGFTDAWDYARGNRPAGGSDTQVEVAVIDTGAQLTHEDLRENIEADLSYDVKTGKKLTETYSSSSGYYYGDYATHGTGVCSVISATTNNGVGIAGTSYGAKVIPIAALEEGGKGTSSDIITALSYIDTLIEKQGHTNLKIVNMSFGTYVNSAALYNAMNHLYTAHDVLFVCAGGNGDENGSPNTANIFPADYDFALSVTSVDANHKRSTWADTNSCKDIAAAGEGMILASTPISAGSSATATYIESAGTSFSAPVVAGAAALLYSMKADLTSSQVVGLLKQTATPISGDYSSCGCAGELNASSAVQALISQYLGGVAPAPFADQYGELPHSFEKHISYKWSADNATCEALGTCDNWIETYDDNGVPQHTANSAACSLTIDETAAATYKVVKAPTASKMGTGVYTATFSGDYVGTVSKTVDIPATGHNYTVSYIWDDSGNTCTATAKCSDCDASFNETVDALKISGNMATCTADGHYTLSASFTNVIFSTQHEKVDMPALGHNYNYTYVWNEACTQCSASKVCANDHTDSTVEVVRAVEVPVVNATCTQAGTAYFTASFSGEGFETQTTSLKVVNARGHDWQTKYAWSSDKTSCTGTVWCSRGDVDAVVETVSASLVGSKRVAKFANAQLGTVEAQVSGGAGSAGGSSAGAGTGSSSAGSTGSSSGSSAGAGSSGGSSAGSGSAGGSGSSSGGSAGGSSATGATDTKKETPSTAVDTTKQQLADAGISVVDSHTYADFAKTENADGSVTYTYTDSTAHENVVRTVTAVGAVCTSVTGSSGAVVTSVDLSGVSAAASAAGPVELPLTASLTAGAFEVRIDGGAQMTISVAISGASPQYVVVKKVLSTGVLQTGTQAIRNSYDGNVVTFALDGDAEYVISVNAVTFDDVAPGMWYKSAVDYVAAHGIMNGMGGKGAAEFAPNEWLSRGMMACVLYNLETGGAGAVASAAASGFSDVSATDWFSTQADWAASAGVITGYADGTFGGNDLITREQVATMLWRYAGSPAVSSAAKSGEGRAVLGGFADAASVSGYAQTAVEWCVASGIIQGNNGNILPGDTATRAEIAAMIERYCAIL